MIWIAIEDTEPLGLSYIAVGEQNDIGILENGLAVFYKLRHILAVSVPLLGICLREMKTYVDTKTIHNVCSSSITQRLTTRNTPNGICLVMSSCTREREWDGGRGREGREKATDTG